MGLTPTEQKIMDLLSDGARHKLIDISRQLDMSVACLGVHIHYIRKKSREMGVSIAHLLEDGVSYYFISRKVSIKSE